MSTKQYYMVTPQGELIKTNANDVENVTTFLQDSVQGWFEVVTMENPQNGETMDMWVNEEGAIRQMPRNIAAEFLYMQFAGKSWFWPLFGNVVFALSNEDGETLPLTERYAGWLDSILETSFTNYSFRQDMKQVRRKQEQIETILGGMD